MLKCGSHGNPQPLITWQQKDGAQIQVIIVTKYCEINFNFLLYLFSEEKKSTFVSILVFFRLLVIVSTDFYWYSGIIWYTIFKISYF
jgi:hypothetical protein